MISNVINVLLLIIIIWSYGVTTISILKLDTKYYTICFSAGIPLFVLSTNLLYYTCYLSSEFVFDISLILALASIAMLIYRRKLSRATLFPLFIVVITFILLLIPNIIGGAQYYTLRGNFYDNFIYLSEAVVIKDHPWNYYLNLPYESFPSVTHMKGFEFVFERPAAALGCAMLIQKGEGDLFFLAVAHLAAFWAMQIMPIIFFLKELIIQNKMNIRLRNVLILLISVGWVFGFWGQISNDISVWAQIMIMPVLMAALFCIPDLFYVCDEEIDSPVLKVDNKIFILLILFLSGAIHGYFEGTLVYLAIAGISIFARIISFRIVKLKEIGKLFLIPIISLSVALIPNIKVMSKSIINAFMIGYSRKVDWHLYYDRYWLGYWGEMSNEYISDLKHIPDYVVSFLGYYFVTPNYNINQWIKVVWWGCTLILSIILLCCCIGGIIVAIRFCIRKESDYVISNICICGISGLSIAGITILSDRVWTGGKILLWTSSLFYCMFFSVIYRYLCESKIKKSSINKIIHRIGFMCICGLITINMYFVLFRYISATDDDGIGMYRNYPNCNAEYWKDYFCYDFNTDVIPKDATVSIQYEDEPVYMRYTKLKLWFADVNYTTLGNDLIESEYVDDYNSNKISDGEIILIEDANEKKHGVFRYTK